MSTSWADIKPWVAKFAPTIGAALGGPFGGAAGALVGAALGIKDASPQSIKDAITTGTLDADHILALKNSEQDFALKMAQLGYDSADKVAELEYKDRDSARNLQIQSHSKTPQVLVGITLAAWIAFNLTMLICGFKGHSLPHDMVGVIMRALGTMDTLLGTGFAYFLGASHKDAAVREMLYNSTPTAPDAIVPK